MIKKRYVVYNYSKVINHEFGVMLSKILLNINEMKYITSPKDPNLGFGNKKG